MSKHVPGGSLKFSASVPVSLAVQARNAYPGLGWSAIVQLGLKSLLGDYSEKIKEGASFV